MPVESSSAFLGHFHVYRIIVAGRRVLLKRNSIIDIIVYIVFLMPFPRFYP